MQSDAPPTRAAAPSPALFSCTAAAVSRRAARPRPLVSRTPLCVARDYYPPRRRRRLSFLRSLVFVLSSFDTFYQERALLNINSNSKTQKREKMGISLFFFVHKTLLYSRPLHDETTRKRKGNRKREKGVCAPCFFFFFFSLSLSLCVCAVSRVVLLYY